MQLYEFVVGKLSKGHGCRLRQMGAGYAQLTGGAMKWKYVPWALTTNSYVPPTFFDDPRDALRIKQGYSINKKLNGN